MSITMPKKASLEMYDSKLKIKINTETLDTNCSNATSKRIGLRGNQLYGSILIGNYDYLKELEVCENEMAVLDLSSLEHLETLTCNSNKLKELVINGKNLTTVTAKYNYLHTMTVSSTPLQLTSLDISHNNFEELPSWIGLCSNLRSLNAEHNRLHALTELFSNYKINALCSLNVGWNNVRTINRLPESFCSVRHLYIQCNELQKLPENFFAVARNNLQVLNASCNKLKTLPSCERGYAWCLEELFLSSNNLDEGIFSVLGEAKKLKVFYVAYNKISELPESCLGSWENLEVLVLSGNVLQSLPDNITRLTKLEVLRLHSNLLLSTPMLSNLSNLKVLDLAHNHLDHVNLLSIMPKSLKYLDLSCNLQLQVDEQQVQVCQSKKKWSLVDVSGKNRSRLPTSKLTDIKDGNLSKLPWMLGFSETVGKCKKLFVCQLRMCSFQTDEGLFGMFESEQSSSQASRLAGLIPQILQQEREVKETMNEYMKYTLLAAYHRLANDDACRSMTATLCHIARENSSFKEYVKPQKTKKFILRVASVGNIGAYLIRKTSNLCLTSTLRERDHSSAFTVSSRGGEQLSFPDPNTVEIVLSNNDEYLVICNANVWAVMDIDRVTREIRKEENTVLAAKRVQDIAQSFGTKSNLSVIVVRFHNVGTDVDHLIKELKQTVRKKPLPRSVTATGRITCSEHSGNCHHRNERSSLRQQLLGGSRSDRSSPSGQSDPVLNLLNKDIDGEDYILNHASVLEEKDEMEMLDETDSALSEEQFKCWEYMLEQNTQLLFDKELNTISKSFTKNRNIEQRDFSSTPDKFECKTNKLMKSFNNKFISTSSPHLLYSDVKKPSFTYHQREKQPFQKQLQVSFLPKQFGSSRSFQTTLGYSLFESKSRNSMNNAPYSKICGGPNAAYFGSLQRLMPYNLEYDFPVTQDRAIMKDNDDDDDDFSEHENRMRKYWGVATTEL